MLNGINIDGSVYLFRNSLCSTHHAARQSVPAERVAETASSDTKIVPDSDMVWVLLLVEILAPPTWYRQERSP